MADKLETIQILLVKRNARKRGRTSSDDFNDMIDEIAHDLTAFNTQWNNRLVPLTTTIPDGTVDSSIDAYTNGLSGRHLYADANATSTINTTYYNTSAGRPYSILEQLGNVYTEIQTVRNELSSDIQSNTPTAEEIVIADSAGNYDSVNVEDALAEVMDAVYNISVGSLDLSEVAQNYVPLNNNTWDIGTSVNKIKKLYIYDISAQGNIETVGQIYSTIPSTLIPTGTTQTVDWDDGNAQVIDLDSATGDVTLTLSNPNAGASYVLKIIQGAIARNLVWPGTVLWPDAITPTISTGNDEIDIVTMFYDGSNFFATIGQNFTI